MYVRTIALTTLLFGAASVAHAETYIEIWNPPEARAHPPVPRVSRSTRSHAGVSVPRLAKRVTEPTLPGESAQALAQSPKKRGVPAIPMLPRKIGPDGRVLQV
ncbi:hypothetical protein [Paraburkholderia megapolitana]|uniref:Uncharacterized protein n=1 Tax=Paraburkholderia megapolitana TaxID=420953 RepID=A0A1I3DKT3_9BURK|nr:hypothetical protein [Paraburkholderia megapolitana]QDQ81912.1 hypothetical protein FNZ07_12550 [Paraburkholderia megapolitana]SFH87372.1 hypothetical protein SAMN05192543_101384 [Paraburkholderia megapolitana]